MQPQTIFCSRCGHNNLGGGSFCQKCGAPLVPGVVGTTVVTAPAVVLVNPYGGFWMRVLAYFIDRIVVGASFSPVLIILCLRMIAEMHRLAPNDPGQFAPIIRFVSIALPLALIVQWLYEALLTSSAWQATVGKRVLNLKVTDEAGNPISFERATGRYFAKILSSLTLDIGYLMVALTARKQGLHDILAGTLVMKTDV